MQLPSAKAKENKNTNNQKMMHTYVLARVERVHYYLLLFNAQI